MTKELEQRAVDQARQLKAAVEALEDEKIEHERVEEKLREIEARTNISADVARLGGWRLDLTTGAWETSDTCKANFGVPPDEEIPFERLFELIHPDDRDRDRVRDALKKAAEARIEYDIEYRVIWPDGSVHWILAHGRTFYTASGTPWKIVGVTQNITEPKRAAERLCVSEERFRRYFELGLIGMAITSPTKGCLEVNDRICEILGYERDELLRMTWAQMTHPDDLAADVVQFNKVLAGEIDSYSMDKRWIRKDGRVIHSTISVYCLRRADGSVDHFVATLQDVTQRKRAEEAFARVRRTPAPADRERGRLRDSDARHGRAREQLEPGRRAGVQPLAAIVISGHTCLRWLEKGPPNLPEARKAVNRIIRDGNRAADVIKRIRALLRKTDTKKARLDINLIIHEVVSLTQGEASKNRVSLETD